MGCIAFYKHVFQIRLVSLAAQKFITDVASDAMVHSTMRGSQPGSHKKSKDKLKVLQVEDLQAALSDMGIDIKKPQYYL